MSFLSTVFTEALLRPMFNALVVLLNVLPFGGLALAIVLLTIIIRLLLYPLSRKSIRSQKTLQEIQPEIEELREQHEDKEDQAKAMMELYQKRGINPLSGCLPLLIQLPVLLALYRVFIKGFSEESFALLYSFVPQPEIIDGTLFGLVDLSERSAILAVVAGVAQFFSSRQMMGARATSTGDGGGMQQMLGKQMVYVMPVITVVIAWSFPAGLPLYWITTTLFSYAQHKFTRAQVQKEDGGEEKSKTTEKEK